MTLPTGPLSFRQIQGEFGGANPISLSEYYRGGGTGYVRAGVQNQGYGLIATSGATSLSLFRGARRDWVKVSNALAKLLDCHGVTFERTDTAAGRRHIGLIAQDVQAVFPEAVHEDPETGCRRSKRGANIMPMTHEVGLPMEQLTGAPHIDDPVTFGVDQTTVPEPIAASVPGYNPPPPVFPERPPTIGELPKVVFDASIERLPVPIVLNESNTSPRLAPPDGDSQEYGS